MVKKYLKILNNTKLTKSINNFSGGIDARTGENLLDSAYARLAVNFDFKTGSLKRSYGISGVDVTDFAVGEDNTLADNYNNIGEIAKSYIFRKFDDNGNLTIFMILINANYDVYEINLTNASAGLVRLPLYFTSLPKFVEYNLNGDDVIIFCSATDSMQVWDGVNPPYSVADAPHFTDVCIHGERLFALTEDTRTLWFSDDLDPTNWDVSLEDAGFIQMIDQRGPVRKVISWNGYIYVFRDFGISRLSATGSQETFALTHLFTSSSKIYCDTVCECGDRVMFLSTDGLYVFDGASTTQILPKVSPLLFKQTNAKACFFDGKYIFSFKLDLSEYGLEQTYADAVTSDCNAVFVIDVTDYSYQILFGVDVKNFCVANLTNDSVLMCVAKDLITDEENTNYVLSKFDEGGKIFESAQPRLWISPYDNFNRPNKTKVLKSIYISTTCDCSLQIVSDKEQCTVSAKASSRAKEYKVMLKGNKFKYMLNCNSSADFEIGQLVFTYYLANSCDD